MTIQYKDFEIKHLPDDLSLQVAADHPIPDDAIGVDHKANFLKDGLLQFMEIKKSSSRKSSSRLVPLDFWVGMWFLEKLLNFNCL